MKGEMNSGKLDCYSTNCKPIIKTTLSSLWKEPSLLSGGSKLFEHFDLLLLLIAKGLEYEEALARKAGVPCAG